MNFAEKMGLDWEYFSFYSLTSPNFHPEGKDGLAELIMKVDIQIYYNWLELITLLF